MQKELEVCVHECVCVHEFVCVCVDTGSAILVLKQGSGARGCHAVA